MINNLHMRCPHRICRLKITSAEEYSWNRLYFIQFCRRVKYRGRPATNVRDISPCIRVNLRFIYDRLINGDQLAVSPFKKRAQAFQQRYPAI